ncbi:MAG: hypothetical protein KAT77_03980 [Nanoarchaeota archaeon]|nr:hypothetical protein [Nanoarchaeota archaeon]
MADMEKDLEKDEDFVLKSIASTKEIGLLADNLTQYFSKYSELGEVKISFDELAKNWKIKTDKGEKTVEYPEGIAQAVMELRE